MSQKIEIVIFDKWAVERIKWSSLIAIGDALKAHAIPFKYFNPQFFKGGQEPEADIIFTWGYNYFHIPEFYQGKADIVLVDRGFLCRDRDYRYIIKNGKLPQGKPADRFNSLGISKPIKKPKEKDGHKGHILICLQNHDMDWYGQAIGMIKSCADMDREVRIRPFDSQISLDDDLRGAYAVVSYNSTCLYPAIAVGLPVFCDSSCFAAEVGETNLSRIESPREVDPSQFLNNLAYAQWTLSEIREGLFLRHIGGLG